jgi:uncharacterized protein
MEFVWRDEGAQSPLAPGAVVVSSFPSAGLAATVAAHYMIQSLKLPRIGRFESPEMAPIAVIQGGIVNPPIRVYGRSDLAVVLSEFPPTPEMASALAGTILEGAIKRSAKMVVCLEGVVPHPLEDGESPEPPAEEKLWVAFAKSDPNLVKTFEPTKAGQLEDGVFGGVSGAALVRGLSTPIPVALLLVSAKVQEGFPDHRAGATLIEAFDRLLPQLKIDTNPLRTQAERIERALRAAMKSHSRAAPTADEGPRDGDEMYR